MPTKVCRPWSHDENRLLRELLAEGAKYHEIVDYFRARFPPGRTRKAIRWRVCTLGLRGNPGHAIDWRIWSQTLTLLQLGYSTRKIARVRKVSQGAVYDLVERMAEQGLVRRVGTKTYNVRYVPTEDWGPLRTDDGAERNPGT